MIPWLIVTSVALRLEGSPSRSRWWQCDRFGRWVGWSRECHGTSFIRRLSDTSNTYETAHVWKPKLFAPMKARMKAHKHHYVTLRPCHKFNSGENNIHDVDKQVLLGMWCLIKLTSAELWCCCWHDVQWWSFLIDQAICDYVKVVFYIFKDHFW